MWEYVINVMCICMYYVPILILWIYSKHKFVMTTDLAQCFACYT